MAKGYLWGRDLVLHLLHKFTWAEGCYDACTFDINNAAIFIRFSEENSNVDLTKKSTDQLIVNESINHPFCKIFTLNPET